MEFVNTTVYSYVLLLRFNNFFAKSKKFMWTFMIVCNFFVSFSVLWNFYFWGFDFQLFLYLMLILTITITYIIMMFVVPRFSLKKSKGLNAVCSYTFKDDQIEISAETENTSETGTIKYSAIHKVMEDNQCFYLFRTKNQAHIIDKDGFINGNADDFREFLRGKIEPKKFKCK